LNNRIEKYSYFIVLLTILLFSIPLAPGCGGGGGGGNGLIVPPATTITVSGRVVAPNHTDREFASRLVEDSDGLNISGVPLAGATVSVVGADISYTADSMGNFTLTGLPAGEEIIIKAQKGDLVFYRGVGASTTDRKVNVNYQTTTAYLYYLNAASDLPAGAGIEYLNQAVTSWGNLSNAAYNFLNCAQDYGTGDTSTPPHQNEKFLSSINGTSDMIPPEVRTVQYSPNPVTAGATLTVTITAFDTGAIDNAHILFRNHENPGEYRTILLSGTPEVSTSENIHTSVIKTKIEETFPAGSYYVDILRISDESDNSLTYTNSKEQELYNPQYVYNSDLELLTVNAGTVDSTAPEFISASWSKDSISRATDSISLTVCIRETQSSINSYSIQIRGNDRKFGWYKEVESEYDSETGIYTYVFTYSGSMLAELGAGVYNLYNVYFRDAAYNEMNYSPSGISFTSSVPAESEEQDMNFYFDSVVLSEAESAYSLPAVAISIEATADYAVPGIELSLRLGEGVFGESRSISDSYWGASAVYNGSTEKWEASGTIYLPEFSAGEHITVYYLSYNDPYNRVSDYFYCNNDECDDVDIQGVTLPSNSRSDSTSPVLSSISFSPDVVTRGSELSVTAEATENGSGLRKMSFYMRCWSCDGIGYSRVTINNFDYMGNGRWKTSFELPFTSRMGTGAWRIEDISLRDFADNSSDYDYSEIDDLMAESNIFTVE